MKCSKCGFENTKDTTYCINCGSRIDGKVRCPKCGEFIEPESNKCPHCGFLVPHNSSSNGFNDKREKIKKVFTKIFAIVSIVIFALAILECWGFYTDFDPKTNWTLEGSAIDYLILRPIDFFKIVPTIDFNSYELASNIIRLTIPFLAVLINVVIVTVASIIGLKKSINSLKNGTYSNHFYLLIVLLSNLFCLIVLSSFDLAYNDEFGIKYFAIHDEKNWFLVQIIINLLIMFISESFFEFHKNKKTVFINRILMSFIFGLGLILLNSIKDPFINIYESSEYYINYGLGYFLCDQIVKVGSSPESIAILVLSISLLVLLLIMIILVGVSIIYMLIHYFNNTYKKHSYYIPQYYLTITILVINVLAFIVAISMHVLLAKDTALDIQFNYSLFVVPFIYAGFPFASTHLIRKINQNEKLAKETSEIKGEESGAN